MNRIAFSASVGLAFIAGCGATYLFPKAKAANEMTAQLIHVPGLVGDALGNASTTGFRSKMFASAAGATISVQVGNVPKHMHPRTNEIQYIVEGTGSVWLGDKEVKIKPGDLLIIPMGTPHGGTKQDGDVPIKAIAIKTPPQPPDDTKLLD